MKRVINNILSLVAVAALTLLSSCHQEEIFEADVTSDNVTVSANRRGINCNGGHIILNVTSNTYWIANVDGADWIEFSPKAAAAGTTEVFITVSENFDEERSAVLSFDTLSGVKEEVFIVQSGSGEQLLYFSETFGSEAVAEDTNINRFDSWVTTGFGSNLTTYDGDQSISSQNPSTVEGSSAGNSLYFTEGASELVIGPISIYGDEYFRFTFNMANRNGAVAASEFLMYASDNGRDWFPFTYRLGEPTQGGWTAVDAWFTLKKNIAKEVYFKIVANAGYQIDDIKILQGYEGDDAPMARVSMDSNPIGFVFFEDDLDYIDRKFSNSTDANVPFADGWSVIRMSSISTTYCSEANVALWLSKGYGYSGYTYVQVDEYGDGSFRIGRSSSNTSYIGDVTLPLNAVSKIDNDAEISVLFSFDLARMNTSDFTVVYVTATTNGSATTQEVDISGITKVKTFGRFEVRFDNVTNTTTFNIAIRVNSGGKATRVAIDDFKIEKI